MESEEAVLGEGGIVAPIFSRRGVVSGAIGISGPRERLLKDDVLATVAESVMEAARAISRDFGSPRWPNE